MGGIATGDAMAKGTVFPMDLGAALERIFAGGEWRLFDFALNPGRERQMNDLSLERESCIVHSNRRLAEMQIQIAAEH